MSVTIESYGNKMGENQVREKVIRRGFLKERKSPLESTRKEKVVSTGLTPVNNFSFKFTNLKT